MALVDQVQGVWFPINVLDDGFTGGNGIVMNATNEIAAVGFQVPRTGNLRRFEVKIQTATNAPDNGMLFSFEANASGLPSGTPLSSVTSAAGTPSAAGWFNPGNFDVDIAVTKGDFMFACMKFSAFTAGDALTIGDFTLPASGWSILPYGINNASRVSSGFPMVAVVYDDGTYEDIGSGLPGLTTQAGIVLQNGTTPDEYGLAWEAPFACRISGCQFVVTLGNQATSLFDVVLYDAGGGVHSSWSRTAGVGLDVGPGMWNVIFPSPLEVEAGDKIRVSILPTAAVNVTVGNHVFLTSGAWTAADGGAEFYSTARTNAGSWTDYNNGTDGYRKPRMSLQLDQLDDGTGGGGGGAHSSAFFG